MKIDIATPRWAVPLIEPRRYKFIRGGRASGKSHERAEAAVEAVVLNKDCKIVCIREIQKSLKYSAYELVKSKIKKLGVSDLFEIYANEIKRIGGDGVFIFMGMQDHTADSIKSLEGFDIAWVEEAQKLSKKSIKLLRPTIRKAGSELWFTWNPDSQDDAIEVLEKRFKNNPNAITIHVNYDSNPFLPAEALSEMEEDRNADPDDFDHVWLGGYNIRKEDRVFHNWKIEECEADPNNIHFGADWGFSQDPTVLLRTSIDLEQKKIYIDHEVYKIGLEIDDTPDEFDKIPLAKNHKIRADSARPEMISHLNKRGFKVEGAKKWAGSVESGISWLKGFQIIIHPRCVKTAKEFRLFSYKKNSSGDALATTEDKNNHSVDAIRYAFVNLILEKKAGWVMV